MGSFLLWLICSIGTRQNRLSDAMHNFSYGKVMISVVCAIRESPTRFWPVSRQETSPDSQSFNWEETMSDIETFVRQYKAGALNRRDFFKRVGALGILMPAASSILAMAGPALAQTAKRGGWLRIAQGNTDNTLEPVRMVDTDDGIYSNCVYQRLTRFTPNLEVEGDAAEEWSVNDTATEWTFKLRSGLTFHNGQSVTSADVVESSYQAHCRRLRVSRKSTAFHCHRNRSAGCNNREDHAFFR